MNCHLHVKNEDQKLCFITVFTHSRECFCFLSQELKQSPDHVSFLLLTQLYPNHVRTKVRELEIQQQGVLTATSRPFCILSPILL